MLLFVVSLGSLAIGVGDFILGAAGDPGLIEAIGGRPWADLVAAVPAVANLVDLHARILGAWLTGFAILAVGISVTAYRRGDRWAWRAMWAMPLAMLLVFLALLTTDRASDGPLPPALVSAPVLAGLSAAGLLMRLGGRRGLETTTG